MDAPKVRVYGYRWVVLAAYMFINITMQVLWICFAPITGPAAQYYGVTDLQIELLAMTFMIVYIPFAFPASWGIDTYGIRKAVGLGAVLLGVFGLLRGIFTSSYTLTLVFTVGLGIAQPFLLNSSTKVAAKWFALEERATATGLAVVAMFIGIVIGQVLSPVLLLTVGIAKMQLIYGIAAAVSAIVFLVLIRENPPTPASPPEYEERALMLDGLKLILRKRDFYFLAYVLFIGNGIFNGIAQLIEPIVRPHGLSITQAGLLGGIMLIGGIVGAVVIPAVSDRLRVRKLILVIGVILALPGLLGVTLGNGFTILAVAIFILGLFTTGIAPVAYQFGAEITYPAPEGTSLGLFTLAGQISVVFIYAMGWLSGVVGSYVPPLLAFAALLAVGVVMLALMRESPMMKPKAA